MGALRQLADDGLVQMVGVSNADVAQIDVARSIVGPALAAVQNQFSPGWRFSADELEHCAAHGLAFLPWSPFGGGSAGGVVGGTAPGVARGAAGAGGSGYPGALRRHPAPGHGLGPAPRASPPASPPGP